MAYGFLRTCGFCLEGPKGGPGRSGVRCGEKSREPGGRGSLGQLWRRRRGRARAEPCQERSVCMCSEWPAALSRQCGGRGGGAQMFAFKGYRHLRKCRTAAQGRASAWSGRGEMVLGGEGYPRIPAADCRGCHMRLGLWDSAPTAPQPSLSVRTCWRQAWGEALSQGVALGRRTASPALSCVPL